LLHPLRPGRKTPLERRLRLAPGLTRTLAASPGDVGISAGVAAVRGRAALRMPSAVSRSRCSGRSCAHCRHRPRSAVGLSPRLCTTPAALL
jgi:hypothetical protein